MRHMGTIILDVGYPRPKIKVVTMPRIYVSWAWFETLISSFILGMGYPQPRSRVVTMPRNCVPWTWLDLNSIIYIFILIRKNAFFFGINPRHGLPPFRRHHSNHVYEFCLWTWLRASQLFYFSFYFNRERKSVK